MEGGQASGETSGVGCGIGSLAIVGAAVLVAAGITLVMGYAPIYPFVFAVTVPIALAIGGLAFLLIRGRATWPRIVVGGFVTGALAPAILLLLPPAADSASVGGVPTVVGGAYTWAGLLQNLAVVGGFGLAGIVGALIVWLLVNWLMKGGHPVKWVVGTVIAGGVLGIGVVPWAAMDRTCHNPMRDGRTSIGPVAEFRLNATMREWPAVQDEIDRFARENGWDVQAVIRPGPGFPSFQVSVCREPGTYIFLTTAPFEEDQISVSVYQPQGGNSWQAPLRKLQDGFERRWPGKVGYDYGEFPLPRPPWAPPAPEPSSAPLRARQKSV
jgi:hypothetical protein